jgi:serine/threonine-protein kinase
MATVWLAEDLRHKRPVAFKVLHPELAASLGADRFQREIETAARLQHPHILGVYDSGDVPAEPGKPSWLWFTMPYVEGESLRDRLAREHQLAVDESVRITRELLAALAYAHAHQVIHRDIKPENILLTEEGHVLVADFGIARSLQPDEAGLTQTGMAMGTPAYMSPEQAMGEPLDGRSDLYSTGCVLYEMLVGEPPYTGPNAQAIATRRLTEPVRPVRATREAVPAGLEQVTLKALARTRADRFATAAEFARSLGGAVITPTATATTPVRTVSRSRHRRVWMAGVAALVVLTAAALLARRSDAPAALDGNTIAVAPFDVLAPDLQLWREGLVDLLARNLDGAGPLHAVPPSVTIKRWRGRPDPAQARALGVETGAGLVVFGTLLRARGDSVLLRASLVQTGRTDAGEEVRVAGRADDVGALADSLALLVLKVIGRDRPLGVVRGAGLGTRQLPVLKAFLQGEAFHRRAAWDSAMVYYRRAVELDSGFALGINRMAAVLGWQRIFTDVDASALALKAGALNHGLPPRDSLLVLADSLAAALNAAPGYTGRWSIRRRLFRTAEETVRRYPQDPFAWYTLAEAQYHYGLGPGLARRPSDQLALWDRIVGLDSSFAPGYVHAIELAMEVGDEAKSRRYSARYAALGSEDRDAAGMLIVDRFLRRESWSEGDLDRLLDTASIDAVWHAAISFLPVPDSAETALRLAHAIVRKPVPDTGLVTSEAWRAYPLVAALGLRGRLQEMVRHTASDPWNLHLPVEMGVLKAEAFRATFGPALEAGRWQEFAAALPGWAAQADTLSLSRVIRWSDSVLRVDTSTGSALLAARVLARSARAYQALSQRDTARALREMVAFADTLCPECGWERLLKARLLVVGGRDREALDLLDQGSARFPLLVPWRLERARIEERLGMRDRAVEDYGSVARLWRNPDPELVPIRDEARAALARLTAEPSS